METGGHRTGCYHRVVTSISRWRRLLFALIPVTILLLISLAAFELVLRSRFDAVHHITGAAPWRQAEWEGLSYGWDLYHPDLGWTNLPGYRSPADAPFSVAINSGGLRAARDYDQTPPDGRVRVAVFGDSLAFGEEVDEPDTVPAWIEALDPEFEALNYGVHGFGLGQSTLRLEAEGGDLGARAVVLMVLFPENLVRASADYFVHAKPVFRLVEGRIEVGNQPVPEASRMPWLMRTSYAAAWLFARRGALGRTSFDGHDHIELGRALVARAAVTCDRRGQKLLVVALLAPGGLVDYLGEPRHRSEIDSSRKRFLTGLPAATFDLVPHQEAAYRRHGAELFAPLAHWSSHGNRLWAEAIAKELRSTVEGDSSS
jgi:hypothetical protein